ncbi:hypothetical protein JAAARDRAFT_333145 [Jaapia argillacea MUCL 33604]|uniref:Uncharacterized protein n=1 Tax=Jaapia argillacea MUCL 33604 TaxID=933084 RepID=A0A067PNC5_9AGAM|nr:hypothetical protein JAAARDRAFT_333145 [Jaapia argillacea MUCL 33604]
MLGHRGVSLKCHPSSLYGAVRKPLITTVISSSSLSHRISEPIPLLGWPTCWTYCTNRTLISPEAPTFLAMRRSPNAYAISPPTPSYAYTHRSPPFHCDRVLDEVFGEGNLGEERCFGCLRWMDITQRGMDKAMPRYYFRVATHSPWVVPHPFMDRTPSYRCSPRNLRRPFCTPHQISTALLARTSSSVFRTCSPDSSSQFTNQTPCHPISRHLRSSEDMESPSYSTLDVLEYIGVRNTRSNLWMSLIPVALDGFDSNSFG